MFKQLRSLAVPLTTVAGSIAAGGYLYDRLARANMDKMDETVRWDEEWDRFLTVPPERFAEVSDWFIPPDRRIVDEREVFDKKFGVSTRQLILVRHGNKHAVEQAQLTGARLVQICSKKIVRKIFHSPEAKQTAEIIAAFFPQASLEESALLAEAVPAVPDPPNSACPPYIPQEGKRLEQGFRTLFGRPAETEENCVATIDLIVGHGNGLRYFVCRALQLDPRFWLRFRMGCCALTSIIIDQQGTVTVPSVADTGHLPVHLVEV